MNELEQRLSNTLGREARLWKAVVNYGTVDSSDDARDSRDSRGKGGRGSRGESRGGRKSRSQEDTGDWRQFFQNNDNVKLKGEEPNFEEEGWARRRPKKK